MTGRAIDRGNGYRGDAKPGARRPDDEIGLELVAVTGRAHGTRHRGAHRAEARLRIRDRTTAKPARGGRREGVGDPATNRHVATAHPGADDDVGRIEAGDQARGTLWIMLA